ncbi:MAG: hypothetical protein EOM76_13090 [Sphingobacteriia bacterium]|nr:hypothetical protein [Sphingobacteriia bacterium]
MEISIDLSGYRDLDGYNSVYKVDENGNVYSAWKNRLLKAGDNGIGYLQVALSARDKHGKVVVKYKKLHRLVAMAFIPNPNNYTDVNHKDGNKKNNHVSNLEWCTHSENIKHSYAVLGRVHDGKKSWKPIICINTGKVYNSATEAAKELGLFTSNISMICNGKSKSTKGYRFKFA